MDPVVGKTLLEMITGIREVDAVPNTEMDCVPIPEDHVRTYFQQLLDAIFYTHRCGIARRDLKLENIIITTDDKLKVCNFGDRCSSGLRRS